MNSGDASDSLLLPSPRRLDVPTREQLLQRYQRTESICRLILGLEIFAITLLAIFWLVRGLPAFSWPLLLGTSLAALGVFRFIPAHVFLNKKRLPDIRPDARLGIHTRDSLVRLSEDVFRRLDLPPSAAPVFLIREKDVNAHAVRCELWPGMRLFNGVFLNRGLLHLFDEPELACVIGHELGHVMPYAPLLNRTYLVHSIFAGALAFTVLALIPHPALAIMAPLGILWLLDHLVAYPHARNSRAIEFLCDDFGAKAGGMLAALSGEAKLAIENETRQSLLLRVLEARKQGTNIPIADLFNAYESAVPFGHANPEEFEREFGRRLASTTPRRGEVSFGGFLSSLSGGTSAEAEASLDETAQQLAAVLSLPLLPIDRTPYLQGSTAWTKESADRLVEAIRNHPHQVLFRTETEIDDRGCSHPNPSRRILFVHQSHSADPSTCF